MPRAGVEFAPRARRYMPREEVDSRELCSGCNRFKEYCACPSWKPGDRRSPVEVGTALLRAGGFRGGFPGGGSELDGWLSGRETFPDLAIRLMGERRPLREQDARKLIRTVLRALSEAPESEGDIRDKWEDIAELHIEKIVEELMKERYTDESFSNNEGKK